MRGDDHGDRGISMTRDSLVFSAAHLLTHDGDSDYEPLHGHDYKVDIHWAGGGDDGGSEDFRKLEEGMAEQCQRLNGRVLLPARSPSLEIERLGRHISVRYGRRLYLFPPEDVVLLPVPDTTTRLLAAYLDQELWNSF